MNTYADPIWNILLRLGHNIITVIYSPEMMAHYIFEDLRREGDETSVRCVAITEFLKNNRGVYEPQTAADLLNNYLKSAQFQTIRIFKVPYVAHSAI